MADDPLWLAEKMRREGEKTRAFFQDIRPQQWQVRVYSEGASWTVHQILAHLVGAEDGIGRLVASIHKSHPGVPQDFDLDAYNERHVAGIESLSPQDLAAKFGELRSANALFVASLSAQDLQRQGRHPWLGVVALEEMVKLLYRHNAIHERDIRRVLSATEEAS